MTYRVLLSPLLLKPKLLIQDLWREKVGWDSKLPKKYVKSWHGIKNDLLRIGEITVGRSINPDRRTCGQQRFQLVCFSDASKIAYAAVIYLKIINKENQSSNTHLIYSKNRLAPIKENITIPRLELMGAVIGCRMMKFVSDQLKVNLEPSILFTDSKCVVEWTKTKKALRRFTGDRVKEIADSGIRIAYAKAEDNPADIASRGSTVNRLLCNSLWWHGPVWIKSDLAEVVATDYVLSKADNENFLREIKGYKVLHEFSLMSSENFKEVTPFGLNEMNYSSHYRLLRVTSWCMRFINNYFSQKGISKAYFQVIKTTGVLTPKEMTTAADMWVKHIQQVHFSDKNKLKSVENNLGVFKDQNGIMRCRGRFSSEHSCPKLLPSKCHYTKLIIVRDHRSLLHQGVSQTLAKVRKEHWIVQGRAAVRKVVRQCLICIHWEGGPFKTPPLAPLPGYVTRANTPPFTYVGLDYIGPLLIKDLMDGNFRKNWVCLFTCLTIRGVHLELVDDMSAESFLLCFRRFVARRGTPSLITSDNASQIKMGNEVIEKIWMDATGEDDVQSFISNKGITWKYVVEYAPWQGGFYERLVGMTKRALRKSLGRSKANNIELNTLLTEVEAMLNYRPLVYINDDINSGEAITPAHFLSLNHHTGVPEISEEYQPKEFSWNMIVENWRKGQAKLNVFWQTWVAEYLPTLRERHILNMKSIKGENPRSPEIGEVVIVKEENMPRGSWKLARITKLIKSEVDGIARAACLISTNGREFRRPFRFLYPLERRFQNNDVDIVTVDNSIDTGAPLPVPPNPPSTLDSTSSKSPPNSLIAPNLSKTVYLPPLGVGVSGLKESGNN